MPRPKKTTTEKKSKEVKEEVWPKITHGSHSIRTEHKDGTVDFWTDWDALRRDVAAAFRELDERGNKKNVS